MFLLFTDTYVSGYHTVATVQIYCILYNMIDTVLIQCCYINKLYVVRCTLYIVRMIYDSTSNTTSCVVYILYIIS